MRDPGHGTPSPRAVAGLAADVGGEVDDLRSRLQGALARAEELEAAGLADQAVAVLEAERAALTQLHRRLEARLADAAVEREAEQVVAGAQAPATAAADPPPAVVTELASTGAPASPVDVPAGGPGGDRGTGLRLLVSAAAGVVGIVLLLVPETGGGALTIAGWGWAGTDDLPVAAEAQDGAAGDVAPGSEGTAEPAVHDLDALRGLALPERTAPLAVTQGRGPDRQGDDGDGASTLGTVEGVLEELGALVEPGVPALSADDDAEGGTEDDDAEGRAEDEDRGPGGDGDEAPIDPTAPVVESRGLGD